MNMKCPRCDFTSKDENVICVHTVEECKNIFTYCEECNINFLDFSLLKEHKILCEDINNEKDGRCQKKILKRRERGIDLHQCCYCDKYFSKKFHLRYHYIKECEVVKAMPLQKQNIIKDSLDYKIICNYCRSGYNTPQEYKVHHEQRCIFKDEVFSDENND